ncbi:MAG: glycosyl hydrolase 53 family protein [Bacteroidales bacterium]|nr:glycosyl hydrolase 53 family protein [Bacteroidales bacterium]
MTRIPLILLCLAAVVACKGKSTGENDRNGDGSAFVLGADISWASEMESDGRTFRNYSGKEGDLVDILDDMGIDAVRLRVFVDPVGGWCGKDDVLSVAKRVSAAGMDLMVDFHYSDFFADPQRQDVPAAWKGLSLEEMAGKVASHTKDVLSALRKAGISVRWVQVGNETRNGMLWDTGRLWNDSSDIPGGWSNYARLSNAGYDAVKSVYPEASVIVHIDSYWTGEGRTDPWWYDSWWFEKFLDAGGKVDIIGLSHYPMTYPGLSWRQVNQLSVNKIRLLSETYGRDVIVCEVGVIPAIGESAVECISDFMASARALDCCSGVFYWEPEVDGVWKPAIYNELGWGAYHMGAFDASGKPGPVMDAFVKK